MSSRFQQLLRNIGKACEDQSLTEAEVEKLFQEHGFFSELGYEGIGKDILAQRGQRRKRFDIALLDFGGRTRAVIEFKRPKRPGGGSLESFQEELFDKYVKPHLAQFGILTDGVTFVLYAKTNGEFVRQFDEFPLAETSETHARRIAQWLQKKTVDLQSLASVHGLLQFNLQNQRLLQALDSDEAGIFFRVLQLLPESPFGQLVSCLKELLPKTVKTSRFAQGSYEFWQKTYARELKFDNTPDSWRPFLLGRTSAEIAQFSFALETAYAIVSRLILAKAAADRGFPGIRFVPRIQESLSELSIQERLKPANYKEIVRRAFERAGENLFPSLFSQDIFDWWFESPEAESRGLFVALAECLLTLTQFDFSYLDGDLLGEIYQRYFDADTRKALGEFYTPPEIVSFILDECGYHGKLGDRLLDPACGSGSFLVAALRRYLDQHKAMDPQSLLRDLTEGLRIVGFDINPFAVLMSQVNYAAMILPRYAEARNKDLDIRIIRLPIFRTDSLRVEEREVEAVQTKDSLNLNLRFDEATLDITVYLPVKEEKKGFVRVHVKVPRYNAAKQQGVISNLEEYVAALARVFQAVSKGPEVLESLLRARFVDRAPKFQSYLGPMLDDLEKTVAMLRDKYDDGRFLKTIEDLVLAVSLKHDLQYDFVVGNPPYVRIQNIPEHVKGYWTDKYEWTERNYDLYIPFLERAVHSGNQKGWLGTGGRLGLILSDRFLNVDYGAKIREHLPEHLSIKLLFDFRDTRVFADALNYPAILIAQTDAPGKEGDCEGVRVFASEAKAKELLQEFADLRPDITPSRTARGSHLEAFAFPRDSLLGPGWWLMPPEERAVFDKLHAIEGNRLLELTDSQSAAFQGIATGADSILVFDQVEDLGDTLKLRPRHTQGECNCAGKPIEIEKGAVKPFLFGKDVGRWTIDWKESWVLFPYDRYPMKNTLHGETVQGWNLIPCKENIKEFQFGEPEKIKKIEDRFPHAWKYLRKHEEPLREREHRRYDKDRRDGLYWYGAARPQNLPYYFRPKLVLQLLSRKSSVASDPGGKFVFQAGGKGGGVYGIVPGSDVPHPLALLAFLNSHVADFLMKETSSVYGGRFYSYADQFLRDIPVANEILLPRSKTAKELAALASRLESRSEERAKTLDTLDNFPDSFASALSRFELDAVARLCTAHPRSAQLQIDQDSISVEQGLYGYGVRFGPQQSFEFEHREHAECLVQALRNRRRAALPLKDVLKWRLPLKVEGCRTLLSLFDQAKRQLENLGRQIVAEEHSLNELVYGIYGITTSERTVIEAFLDRFSSKAADRQTGE